MKQQRGYMKDTCVNISGKLPKGLIELYKDINNVAGDLKIRSLVVGAMARDLVLVHGFGSTIERGTRDVDFGIRVESWDQFFTLQNALVKLKFKQDEKSIHKFTRIDIDGLPWEIDIVPFGNIVDKHDNIHWPPKGYFVMNVTGFNEALEHALQVTISDKPTISIPVASPVGVAILKLIAWLDRETDIRKKDASDIKYLINTYHKIPNIENSLYSDEDGRNFLEKHDWDVSKASAIKLGFDISKILTVKSKEFIKENIFLNEDNIQQFAREMDSSTNTDLDENLALITLLGQGILEEE